MPLLRAAASCVRAIAEAEHLDPDVIEPEVAVYEAWAVMAEDGSGASG